MRQYSIAITYFILLQIVTFDYLFTCLTLLYTLRLIISSKPRKWQERSRRPASLLEARLQGSSWPLRPPGRLPLPQVGCFVLVLSNLKIIVFYSRRCEEAPPLPARYGGPARDPPLPEVDRASHPQASLPETRQGDRSGLQNRPPLPVRGHRSPAGLSS